MLVFILISFLSAFQQEEIPYLETDYYSYELDYAFVNKTTGASTTVDFTKRNTQSSSLTPLPYVKVQLTLKDLKSKFVRCRITNNKGGTDYNKKIKKMPLNIEIDMGFAEDIKDKVGPNVFTVNLLNADKETERVVVFEFDVDGNMFVNGVHRGKI